MKTTRGPQTADRGKANQEEIAALEAKKKARDARCKPEADRLAEIQREILRRSSKSRTAVHITTPPKTKGGDHERQIFTALAVGFAAALQPLTNAQFGSGVVFDPTQAGHAVTQIEHEEQSIANEARQIEQGQQIFTNTVKIATTALQATTSQSNNMSSRIR